MPYFQDYIVKKDKHDKDAKNRFHLVPFNIYIFNKYYMYYYKLAMTLQNFIQRNIELEQFGNLALDTDYLKTSLLMELFY